MTIVAIILSIIAWELLKRIYAFLFTPGGGDAGMVEHLKQEKAAKDAQAPYELIDWREVTR